VFYTGDWNSIKLSAAASYTWIETGVTTVREDEFDDTARGSEVDLFQVGASIMHKPSGLGIYGLYQHEETDTRVTDTGGTWLASPSTFPTPMSGM
jgi:hypothetical protein